MRNAVRSKGVTMYLEPKFLYNYRPTSASMPGDDYIVPFGKAKIRKAGNDVTLISYGNAVHISLRAAQRLADEGISCEVIDLRSLAPWDKQAVFASVKKTGRAVIAHEHYLNVGFGAEIASTLSTEMFRYLDAPVRRVASKDVPVGFAKSLEGAILLNEDDVMHEVRRVFSY
jgi:2-oxoisovalerate dehydrogenase E1 component